MAARHFPAIGYGLLTAFSVVIVAGAIAGPSLSNAHPGETDAFGCHICTNREPCEAWGLQVGQYHCHNDGKNKNAPNDVKPLPPQIHAAAPGMPARRAPKPLSRRAQAIMNAISSRRAARSASSSSSSSSSSRGTDDRDADAYAQLSRRYCTALESLRHLADQDPEPVRTDLHTALDYYEEALNDFDNYAVITANRPLHTEELRSVVGILRTIDRALSVFGRMHVR